MARICIFCNVESLSERMAFESRATSSYGLTSLKNLNPDLNAATCLPSTQTIQIQALDPSPFLPFSTDHPRSRAPRERSSPQAKSEQSPPSRQPASQLSPLPKSPLHKPNAPSKPPTQKQPRPRQNPTQTTTTSTKAKNDKVSKTHQRSKPLSHPMRSPLSLRLDPTYCAGAFQPGAVWC